jgi:hypothetical protein
MIFSICKESDQFGLLRSVDVPIRDINKCKKEYQEYAKENNISNPFDINYVDGMNICAGETGKGICDVRFIIQK